MAESPSLMEAYERWQAAQAAKASDPLAKAADATPADVEALAWEKSRRRVAKRLRKGKGAAEALAAGFKRYKRLGGRMTLTTWHKKVTA